MNMAASTRTTHLVLAGCSSSSQLAKRSARSMNITRLCNSSVSMTRLTPTIWCIPTTTSVRRSAFIPFLMKSTATPPTCLNMRRLRTVFVSILAMGPPRQTPTWPIMNRAVRSRWRAMTSSAAISMAAASSSHQPVPTRTDTNISMSAHRDWRLLMKISVLPPDLLRSLH